MQMNAAQAGGHHQGSPRSLLQCKQDSLAGLVEGLCSMDLPSNVSIRKAQRRIHEDDRRLGQRSSSGFLRSLPYSIGCW